MGSKSLTKQWERSIDLSTEEWIWLFSDDDIVDADCVDNFYKTHMNNSTSKLFKFHTKKIDFLSQGIKLEFINSLPIQYKQFNKRFVPWLSIIDVLMFNTKDEIKIMLDKYELI